MKIREEYVVEPRETVPTLHEWYEQNEKAVRMQEALLKVYERARHWEQCFERRACTCGIEEAGDLLHEYGYYP